MHKRIYGIEREYGFFPRAAYEFDDFHLFFSSLLPRARGGLQITPEGSEFLANGGRARIDTGQHPETATPECGSVRDCVIWDAAGERILEDIALRFHEGVLCLKNGRVFDPVLREKIARCGGIAFLKNNAAPHPYAQDRIANLPAREYASWGSHLNILLDKRAASKYDAALILAPFCFSSAWLTGSGMVWVTDKRRLAYSLSQRMPFVQTLHDQTATQSNKPMFLLRDESLADPEKYFRLQIAGMDSSLCEWQTYVPLVIMGIILRMAEDGFVRAHEYCNMGFLSFQDELTALKNQTLLWGCERSSFSFRGETHTAASLHRKYYLEPIVRYKASGVPWSDEEEDGVQKYAFLIDAFERARSSRELARAFSPYLGWAAKLQHLILSHMRQHRYFFGCSSEHAVRVRAKRGAMTTSAWERLKIFDTFFHDIRRSKSFYHRLAECGLMRRIVAEDEILRAKEYPPSGTRAEARDRRMAELRSREDTVLTALGWTHLEYRLNVSGHSVIEVNNDPFGSDSRGFKIYKE